MSFSCAGAARVGPDDVVLWATPGWLALYAPGQDPSVYVGRNHIDFFNLREYPEWLAQYESARAGGCGVYAMVIAAPGMQEVAGTPTAPLMWWILSDGQGGVLIFTDLAECAVGSLTVAESRAGETAQVWTRLIESRHG